MGLGSSFIRSGRRLSGFALGGNVLAGGHSLGPLKDPREIELVEETHRDGNLRNGQVPGSQQFAGNPYALGNVVNGNIVGLIELDVFDGVQHILIGRGGVVGAAFAGFLHQGGDEQVEVTHHGGFILGL